VIDRITKITLVSILLCAILFCIGAVIYKDIQIKNKFKSSAESKSVPAKCIVVDKMHGVSNNYSHWIVVFKSENSFGYRRSIDLFYSCEIGDTVEIAR
jgi:hypothetical protein